MHLQYLYLICRAGTSRPARIYSYILASPKRKRWTGKGLRRLTLACAVGSVRTRREVAGPVNNSGCRIFSPPGLCGAV